MEVIAVANQKGGVGKSVTAAALSAGLSIRGYRVLSIDLDAQRNFSFLLHVMGEDSQTVLEVLTGDVTAEAAIRQGRSGDAIAASPQLVAADFLITGTRREYRLMDALKPINEKYDFAVLDTPPALGTLTVNALTTANSVLVPIQCEFYAMEGLTQLMYTIQLVQKKLNPSLQMEGVVFTMYDVRTNLSQQVVDSVKQYLKDKVYDTIIPRNVRLAEAPSHGMPIMEYDSRSNGAEAYRKLADEVIRYD